MTPCRKALRLHRAHYRDTVTAVCHYATGLRARSEWIQGGPGHTTDGPAVRRWGAGAISRGGGAQHFTTHLWVIPFS